MKIAIITACPCGMAHSRMASEALQQEAKKLGYEVFIEEQGGFQNPQRLKQEQIEKANVVILAAAIVVSGMERFKGKQVLEVSVKDALMHPKETLKRAVKLTKKK